jgi:hypothetical protein
MGYPMFRQLLSWNLYIDTCDCLFWGNLFSDKPTLATMKGREQSLVCLVASPKSPDMFSVDVQLKIVEVWFQVFNLSMS